MNCTPTLVDMGLDDFYGYSYFFVCLYWACSGLRTNIVEEYVLLSASLVHAVVRLRTLVVDVPVVVVD